MRNCAPPAPCPTLPCGNSTRRNLFPPSDSTETRSVAAKSTAPKSDWISEEVYGPLLVLLKVATRSGECCGERVVVGAWVVVVVVVVVVDVVVVVGARVVVVVDVVVVVGGLLVVVVGARLVVVVAGAVATTGAATGASTLSPGVDGPLGICSLVGVVTVEVGASGVDGPLGTASPVGVETVGVEASGAAGREVDDGLTAVFAGELDGTGAFVTTVGETGVGSGGVSTTESAMTASDGC